MVQFLQPTGQMRPGHAKSLALIEADNGTEDRAGGTYHNTFQPEGNDVSYDSCTCFVCDETFEEDESTMKCSLWTHMPTASVLG
ncbi:hypothetical protein L345_05980, partial [Ophiophagus hannah]